MKKNVLLLISMVLAVLIPSGLSAEVIAEKTNRTVKGNKKDTLEVSMSPGTYKFTLTISSDKGKNPNPKFKIQQRTGTGVAYKTLFESKYGKGTHEGQFEVEAKQTSSASGNVDGSYHYTGISGGASASGGFEAETNIVEANRKVKFTVKNPIGKRKIKYSLKIYRDNQVQVGAIERNTDRMGNDYQKLTGLRDATECQNRCKDESRCLAWTFVKPNTIQGPNSQCYLKDRVPPQTVNNACDSGLIHR